MRFKNNIAALTNMNSTALEIIKISLGVLILFAGSQIAIPLQPVPITMQTVSVMLIGLLYSTRAGLLSVISYVLLGGLGLPIFQGFSGGLNDLLGPTGGYLFGFIFSIYAMILLRKKLILQSFWAIFLNCSIGTVVVFIFGLSWLAMFIGVKNAIVFGLLPFIIPGILKAIVLSMAVRYIVGSKDSE